MKKTTRTLTIIATLVALAALATFGTSRVTPSARASWEASPIPAESSRAVSPLAAPTPDYTVLPSHTDGPEIDCPNPGIGCVGRWGDYAPNEPHALSVPASKNTGKLLVFLTGAGGKPAGDFYHGLYNVATLQGYHVIGLTYFTGTKVNQNGVGKMCDNNLSCYEKFMREVIDGTNCEADECSELNIDEHPQDSIVSRLVRVLQWARAEYPDHGWGRYLTPIGPGETVKWDEVHLAGFSLGSGHAALMGILYPDVKRVSLFAGPNDGRGSSEDNWETAKYIERVAGITDTHYYGLVHELNRATDNGSTLYKVIKAWRALGMGTPYNLPRRNFDPETGTTPDFRGAHMLISTDKGTIADKAHTSVILNEYVNCEGVDPADPPECTVGKRIGYGPAWRCVLGTGDASVSATPVADAGPNQTVECQGFGGAGVELDGSGSEDDDCDVLSYSWAAPFGPAVGWKPAVFLPLGANTVTLWVKDPWRWSAPDTTQITVVDTKPPALQVALTPEIISTANHRLVRIRATVSASDTCGGAPVGVVLTSITSSEPDSGAGPGDLGGDIQGADFGTFDQNFVLRAEAYGSGWFSSRIYTITYTATDASGNSRQKSATVRVQG